VSLKYVTLILGVNLTQLSVSNAIKNYFQSALMAKTEKIGLNDEKGLIRLTSELFTGTSNKSSSLVTNT
jgi:hypothetical protein